MKKLEVGDKVLYGSHSVCEIVAIEPVGFSDTGEDYYHLKPCYENTSFVYVPCKNEALVTKMKRIMSREEIYQLIETMLKQSDIWENDDTKRKEKFAEIIKREDRREMVGLIQTLHNKKEQLKECGKKLHATDEKFLKEAERLLYDELSYVLNIKREQVIPFICSQAYDVCEDEGE